MVLLNQLFVFSEEEPLMHVVKQLSVYPEKWPCRQRNSVKLWTEVLLLEDREDGSRHPIFFQDPPEEYVGNVFLVIPVENIHKC